MNNIQTILAFCMGVIVLYMAFPERAKAITPSLVSLMKMLPFYKLGEAIIKSSKQNNKSQD